jgi:hypothetical protein
MTARLRRWWRYRRLLAAAVAASEDQNHKVTAGLYGRMKTEARMQAGYPPW